MRYVKNVEYIGHSTANNVRAFLGLDLRVESDREIYEKFKQMYPEMAKQLKRPLN